MHTYSTLKLGCMHTSTYMIEVVLMSSFTTSSIYIHYPMHGMDIYMHSINYMDVKSHMI